MRKAISTEQLLQKWAPMLEAGEKIQSRNTKKALAQIFENTAEDFAKHGLITEGMKTTDGFGTSPIAQDGKSSVGYLKGKFGREGTDAGTDAQNMYLPNVIMPMVRRIFPSLIAHELVGVQALNGPVGYALAYRAKLGGKNGVAGVGGLGSENYPTIGGKAADEMAFAPVDARYTGISAEVKMGDDTTKSAEAWEAYAGPADKGGQQAWNGQGIDTATGEYLNYTTQVPTVGFDFLKSMVEARTRKLGAGWSPELAEDMEAVHGFDVESEFVNMISYEIGAEIDRQLITEMVKTAITGGSVVTWNPAQADGLDQMGRLATLLTQITIEANQIAIRTRRGHANFVVTSPRVTALLEQLSFNKFVSIQNTTKPAPSVPDSGVGVLAKVGLINDGQQLLIRDTYAAGDYILMGYKGAHPADNGIIYCPYIPVLLQKVLDPFTLTNLIGARTRYGVMNSVWDAKNYYTFMNVKLKCGTYELGEQRHFVQDITPVKNGTLFV